MHIKQIIIQGFKSYKDQTVIEPFSPKHNVVVGRNGSGKSNFFAAVRFVLSDSYTNMSREERQALLHEGSGPTIISAYVEIIFDNSDNRFPTGKDEVRLRRTIGLKKDEWSIDKKTSSRADVMNLLESAGFSRANPYYIVPQGRITFLTNAKDNERLKLLKDVAGTDVYEQRRKESLKIMEDTDSKREKIKELLKYIQERLQELESEKEELKKYQSLDRERRCLEYTVYQREQGEIIKALDEIESEHRVYLDGSDQQQHEYFDRQKRIEEISTLIRKLEEDFASLKIEQKQIEDEKDSKIKLRTRLELRLKETERTKLAKSSNNARREIELSEIKTTIESRVKELNDITPKYEIKIKEEIELCSKIDQAEAEQQTLYAKQGRYSQFKSKNQRDKWLTSEIQNVQETISTHTLHAEELSEDIKKLEEDMDSSMKHANKTKTELLEQKSKLQEIRIEEKNIQLEIQSKTDQRKELWRDESKLSTPIENAKEELQKAERVLASTLDRQTRNGLACLPRIVEENNIRGYHGPLYDLFEVDETYRTAVEIIAGSSLFHVVVDDDHVAAKILEHLNRERLGRVTFMPLNRLKPKIPEYPQTNDSIPMIRKLTFNKVYENALKQVFGKTIICPNLQISSAYAKSHKLNAITLDGDKAERKGALTGGFIDSRRSRLDSIKNVRIWKLKNEELNQYMIDIKRNIMRIEQSITGLKGKQRKLELQRQEILLQREPLHQEYNNSLQESTVLRERLINRQKSLMNIQNRIGMLNMKVSAYEKEMKTEFSKNLSIEEETRLEHLVIEMNTMRTELVEISKQRGEFEERKIVIEDELNQRLYKRRNELEEIMTMEGNDDEDDSKREFDDEMEMENENQNQNSINERIKKCIQEIKKLEKEGIKIEKEMTEKKKLIENEQNEIENLQIEQSAESQNLDKHQKKTEIYVSKRNLLIQKREECMRNIRDLGVLPEEAFDKYMEISSQKLVKQLHKVNEGLKKYFHVNKKAFEQYKNFTEQKEKLIERRKELDESAKSIKELISVLDQRKDEAIERTFKQVARNFSEIFEKLVPIGAGQLIMQRRFDLMENEIEEENNEELSGSSVDNYIGIAIQVSFISKKLDDSVRIQQLSGGQKSLCALALIFSIQKCDPAPFYLFDEIDANLDAQYRTCVAAMIHEQSEKAQFITTTFRPEMLTDANQFYGVLFTNKVSSIHKITRDDAMEFVEHEQARPT